MIRTLPTLLLAVALAGAAPFVPGAIGRIAPHLAGDDPAAVAAARLAVTPDATVAARIEAALAAGDPELAAALAAVAAGAGRPVDPALGARIDAANAFDPGRLAGEAADGFLSGSATSEAGFAGSLAADLTGFGDLRDLAREGLRAAGGESVDGVTVMIAAAGLGITAATWTSLGAGTPARAGASLLKLAHRSGRIAAPLRRELAGLAARAVDGQALRAVGSAATAFDLPAARRAAAGVLRPGPAREAGALVEAVGTLGRTAGTRGTLEALAVAETGDDLRRAARLARAEGTGLRAHLALFGRGALVAGAWTMSALWALAGLAGWLVAGALVALSLAVRLVRLIVRIVRLLLPARRPVTA
jgi:hypothetical protein